MGVILPPHRTFIFSLLITILVGVKASQVPRQSNISAYDTTIFPQFHELEGPHSDVLSTSMHISSLSPKINMSKSRHSLVYSGNIRTRENKNTASISSANPTTTRWPLLRNVINHRNNKRREVHKLNSLVEDNKSANNKSRKRSKRRRRIVERKGRRNRASRRKILKQRKKIKLRMKSASITHSKAQISEKKTLPTSSSFSLNVKPSKSNKAIVSNISSQKHHNWSTSQPPHKHTKKNFKDTKSKSKVVKPLFTEIRSIKIPNKVSHTSIVTNQGLAISNDSMLADEALPNVLSGLEPEVSMMDYAWNEDKIEIDFKTGKRILHIITFLQKSMNIS